MARTVAPIRRAEPPVAVVLGKAATAAGPLSGAIAALRSDLELYQHKTVEIEGLIERLTAYTNGAADGGLKMRKRRGRPPGDPEKQRAKKRQQMRERRAREKEAAATGSKKKPRAMAAAAAAATEAKPKHGPKRRELTASESRELEEIWTIIKVSDDAWAKTKKSDPNFRTVRATALRNRRLGGKLLKRLGQRVLLPLNAFEVKLWQEAGCGSDEEFELKLAGPPKQQISEFVEDENGVLTRMSVAVGNGAAAT